MDVRIPPGIALDGCRNAYLCLVQAQFMTRDRALRLMQMEQFASEARRCLESLNRDGGLLVRWKARQWLARIARICAEEGIPIEVAAPSRLRDAVRGEGIAARVPAEFPTR